MIYAYCLIFFIFFVLLALRFKTLMFKAVLTCGILSNQNQIEMKRYLLLTLFSALSLVTSAQYYLRGDHNGWGTSNQLLHRSDLGGGTYSTLFQASVDQEFKIANQDYSHQWGGGFWVYIYNVRNEIPANGNNAIWKGDISTYTQINCLNPAAHVDTWLPHGILTLSEYPVSVVAVSQVGIEAGGGIYKVSSTQPQTVSINLSTSKSAQEYVYLRYTTNGWANSSWILASGSGTSYTALIPGQPNGTTVSYYVLTSTLEHSYGNFLDQYPDLMTLNYNTNSGNNWTYNVEIGFPLDMKDFRAQRKSDKVLLSWTALNESNISDYEIQRSLDGHNFKAIGKVAAAAAMHDMQNYSFTDEKPLCGHNFYRIRINDLDGGYSYSSSESIFIPYEDMEFGIYPVLATERISLEFGKPAENGTIAIYDIHGQMIRSFSLEKGISRFEIDISDLKKGMFVIRYIDGIPAESRKFFRI